MDNFWSKNFSKSPLCTPHVASGFLRTFYFFVKIFLSPRYVLHLLQVAVLMYSTYCKWLIFEFFFFALRTIPSPPNVLHMLQVAFEQLFIFWSKFSKSPLFTPLAASGCWTKNSFPQSLFFCSIVVTYVVEVNFPLYFVTGT